MTSLTVRSHAAKGRYLLLLAILTGGIAVCRAQDKAGADTASYTMTMRDVLKYLDAHDLKILGTIMPNPDLRVRLSVPGNTPPGRFMEDCLSGTIYTCYINTAGISFGYWGPDTSTWYRHLEATVTNETGEPLPGVNITANGNTIQTDSLGHFSLPVRAYDTWVGFTHVGFNDEFIKLSNKTSHRIPMKIAVTNLDAIVISPYGNTTQRKNPGDVYALQKNDADENPSGSLLEELAAQVPGLYIRTVNGVPGTAPIMTLGGTHSISNGNNPALIFDGVPLAYDIGLDPIPTGSAQGKTGACPYNFLQLGLIDSISVPKDASAISIYGSNSANGIILITPIQAKPDSTTRVSVDLNQAIGHVEHTSRDLTTPEFLQLRQDAVKNAGPYTTDTVPERQWGNRQNNYQRLTTGGTARISNARLTVNGGNSTSYYLVSGGIHRETGVFPSKTTDERNNVYANLHFAPAQTVQIVTTLLYAAETNHLPIYDPTGDQRLAPNAIPFYDPLGHLQWGKVPLSIFNIPADGYNAYTGNTHTLFAHLKITCRVNKHLSVQQDLGYNGIGTDERSTQPKAAQDTTADPGATGTLTTANNRYTLTMIETIARWNSWIKQGEITTVLGVDRQNKTASFYSLARTGYTSDPQLYAGDTTAASTPSQNKVDYRYAAIFAKLDYVLAERYLLTASWRCDGSSRFGPGNQYGNFWAMAAGWIFTEEPFLRGNYMLSYGKIRTSIGTTGNDQIRDGGYAEVYGSAPAIPNYTGQQGVVPVSLANNHLRWEQNYHSETALETGFLKNKILLSLIATRNWSANQVINAPVAPAAGLSAVYSNQPVEIVNRSFEMILETGLISTKTIAWKMNASITIPRNRIARWPGLANSQYATTYVLGRSLTVTKGYHLIGVDPRTGLDSFRTNNPKGIPGLADEVPDAGLDPKWYAGWNNRIRMNHFEIGFLIDIRFGNAVNPLIVLARQNRPGRQAPGQLSNGPKEWLDHWNKPGDHALLQKPTLPGTPDDARQMAYMQSDAWSIKDNFLRFKNLSVTYHFPNTLLKKLNLRSGKLYLTAQNLCTLTKYPVTDPETQDPLALPPLRVISAGISVGL